MLSRFLFSRFLALSFSCFSCVAPLVAPFSSVSSISASFPVFRLWFHLCDPVRCPFYVSRSCIVMFLFVSRPIHTRCQHVAIVCRLYHCLVFSYLAFYSDCGVPIVACCCIFDPLVLPRFPILVSRRTVWKPFSRLASRPMNDACLLNVCAVCVGPLP